MNIRFYGLNFDLKSKFVLAHKQGIFLTFCGKKLLILTA